VIRVLQSTILNKICYRYDVRLGSEPNSPPPPERLRAPHPPATPRWHDVRSSLNAANCIPTTRHPVDPTSCYPLLSARDRDIAHLQTAHRPSAGHSPGNRTDRPAQPTRTRPPAADPPTHTPEWPWGRRTRIRHPLPPRNHTPPSVTPVPPTQGTPAATHTQTPRSLPLLRHAPSAQRVSVASAQTSSSPTPSHPMLVYSRTSRDTYHCQARSNSPASPTDKPCRCGPHNQVQIWSASSNQFSLYKVPSIGTGFVTR